MLDSFEELKLHSANLVRSQTRYLNGAGSGNRAIVFTGKGNLRETLSVSCRADPASAGLNLGGPSVGRRHLMQGEGCDPYCAPPPAAPSPPSPPVESTKATTTNTGTTNSCCFPSGSTVQTPRGKKTMAELQVGDKVSHRGM
jgi:hypothetical protein